MTTLSEQQHAESEAAMRRVRLKDVRRRIRNLTAAYPPDVWTLEQAEAVLRTLESNYVARCRQGAAR